jgi:hypothetical protein
MSHLEPLKIRNSHPNKARSDTIRDLADKKVDITQKMESIHHPVEHQQHQEVKALEKCNSSPTTTTSTNSANSDDDS